jgi:hypothetical protein
MLSYNANIDKSPKSNFAQTGASLLGQTTNAKAKYPNPLIKSAGNCTMPIGMKLTTNTHPKTD